MQYFGPWDNPQKALDKFNREWPYLSKGLTPPPELDGSEDRLTVGDLCNLFLEHKERALHSRRITRQTYAGYFRVCKVIVKPKPAGLGRKTPVDTLTPSDFESFQVELAKTHQTPESLGSIVNRVRMVFLFATSNEGKHLIDRPVEFGKLFTRPDKKQVREQRYNRPEPTFTAAECKRILKECDLQLKAMVLLGLNAGLGNTDIAYLTRRSIDLKTAWLDFPRVKTAVPRRVPLWPETVKAIRDVLADKHRALPKNPADSGLVFLTSHGNPWVRTHETKNEAGEPVPVCSDAISRKMERLLKRLKIGGRNRLSFYRFRHTFETVAGESADQVAVDAIMGHVDPSMAANYRHRISDERLKAVVDVVHAWLWPQPKRAKRMKTHGGANRERKPRTAHRR